MDAIKDTIQKVSDAVSGKSEGELKHGHSTAESGLEPASGVQGQGNLKSPFDQGNAQGHTGSSGSGAEPDVDAPTTSLTQGDDAGATRDGGRGGGGHAW